MPVPYKNAMKNWENWLLTSHTGGPGIEICNDFKAKLAFQMDIERKSQFPSQKTGFFASRSRNDTFSNKKLNILIQAKPEPEPRPEPEPEPGPEPEPEPDPELLKRHIDVQELLYK